MLNARRAATSGPVAPAHIARQRARAAHSSIRYVRPSVSALPPAPQPTVTSDDGTRTLRLRQHGNRKLPLPPLMDEIAVKAKERYTAKKPRQEVEELTDFQKALAANPYGEPQLASRIYVKLSQDTQRKL